MSYLRCIFRLLLVFVLISGCNRDRATSEYGALSKVSYDSTLIDNMVAEAMKIAPAYPDSARKLGEEIIRLSAAADYPPGIADGFYVTGQSFWHRNIYDSSIHYYSIALKKYAVIQDTLKVASTWHKISINHSMASQIENALQAIDSSQYYYKMLKDTGMIYYTMYIQSYYQGQLQNTENQATLFKEMEKLIQHIPDKAKHAHFYNNLANFYVDQANLYPALDLYFDALALAEKVGDTFQAARAMHGMGIVNFHLKKFNSAIEDFQREEELLLADTYNLGKTYLWLGKSYAEKEDYSTSLDYMHRSLSIRRRMHYDLETQRTLQNLALVHYYRNDSLDVALEYLQEAVDLNKGIRNNRGLAENLVLQGKIESLTGNTDKARNLVEEGLRLGKEHQIPNAIMEADLFLSEWYAEQGRFREAYDYYLRYDRLNDSLVSGKNYTRTTQLEMQYDFNKKQNETELQHLKEKLQIEAELKRNKTVRNFLFLIGTILVVLIGFIIRSFFRIRRAEREKSALLKEIHHRVKNNLQVISSLLNLQSGRIDDSITRAAVSESQNRVKSMALIHQLLYQAETFTSIDFGKYLEQLMSSLHKGYRQPGKNIRYAIEAEPITLDIDVAIPLGLIINELATNSYKYAFSDRDEGKIEISFSRTGDKELSFSIADDGVGFPMDFDLERSDSLGLKLVRLLSRQIRAKLEYQGDKGVRFKLLIPLAA